MANSSKPLDLSLVFLAVCVFGLRGEATAASQTNTYLFVPEQSKVVQTGGIAYIHRTYSIKGEFQLIIGPNVGTASFARVDANATDDSPFKRTLDPNHVFNMTSLVGTVEPTGSIKFTGKASDDSDVAITATLQDGLAHLIGQTTPPPNSADFFIFSLDAVAQLRKYGGGSGTAEDPYQIATAEDLIALGETPEDYDKHFILTDDIDLAGHVFDKAVIAADVNNAKSGFQQTAFTGVFDGEGHRILNLTINGIGYLGLLGVLDGAEVKNVGVVDVNITGSDARVGGLVGYNYNGTVTQCYSAGAVIGSGLVGGLVGDNGSYLTMSASVADSYSSGTVTGDWCVGGLAGFNTGQIATSYSTGIVKGTGRGVGGLVGQNGENWYMAVFPGDVTECYSTAAVSGDSEVGGLVGFNPGNVTMSYSTGVVDGTGNCVGGLVGYSVRGRITTSWSTSSVNGNSRVGGLVGYNGGSITISYSTGVVKGTSDYVGGFVGWNHGGRLTDNYSTGTVIGENKVGGLVGYNTYGSIINSYSTGSITGTNDIGGLVGDNYHGSIAASFWDTKTTGLLSMCGIQDVDATGCLDSSGKTTAEMQTASTFLEAIWDFVNIWGIGENQTYPYLRKYSAADINQDASVNFLDLAVLAENWLATR